MDYQYDIVIFNADEPYQHKTVHFTHGGTTTITAPTISSYTYQKMWVNGYYYEQTSYTLSNIQLKRNLAYDDQVESGYESPIPVYLWYPSYGYPQMNKGGLFMVYEKNSCIVSGTMITLADGTQKAVEQLTGDEMLLVWNLHTGSFDTAPILFIDSDSATNYRIINLFFSDGTQVKVIYEHGFYDLTLNKYVYLRKDAAQYIGHWFNKQTNDSNGNMIWISVQLTNVTITTEYTAAWSPVTYDHLCYYVNGMLSMPGATESLVNIFDVDVETMRIDQEQYEADIFPQCPNIILKYSNFIHSIYC